MKNVSTVAEGEEKIYMEPNIHIRIPEYTYIYVPESLCRQTHRTFPSENQLTNQLKRKKLFECQGI